MATAAIASTRASGQDAKVLPLFAQAARVVPTPASLMELMSALITRASAVDTRRFESSSIEEIRRELVPELEATLEQARATLTAVAARYDEGDEETLDSFESNDFGVFVDALMRTDSSAKQIADIATIACMELAQRRARMRELHARATTWDYIADAASARRRVLKSATAIQRAIAEHEGLECQNAWYLTELERSLEVRRVYAEFRDRLAIERPPRQDEMYARLRLVGTSLAMLIGHDIYEFLRVPDRRMFRELQTKVIEWLRVDASRSGRYPARAGARIWQDIAAFANLLMQVNHRAELREHDAELLSSVATALRAVAGPTPAATLARLRAVRGRDDALDRRLAEARRGASPLPADELRALASRLAVELAGPQSAPRW
ncbi:MAG: hypothetical protein H6713_41305 [Myxococcales bacterium]|nr:hypothetical protein [Myxococcales bacterium]MCB9756401.1 hypothetical protein [Myxococcales bacterium]